MNSMVRPLEQRARVRRNILGGNAILYLIMAPGIIFFLLFSYLPMVGMIIAFQDFNPLKGFFSDFIGFKNFEFFFTNSDWILVTWNTLWLNFLFIGTGTLMAIFIAILVTEVRGKWFVKITQSIIILPHFISWPVVATIALAFFSMDGGSINNLLTSFGAQKINFYSQADLWPPLLVVLRIWKEAGFGAILYIATIVGIDRELYEAAMIDGAGRISRILRITLPLLVPTVILLTLLALGRMFYGDFGMVYSLIGDNSRLYPTTDVIDTYVFRALRLNGDFGMSAAIGLYQSVVGFLLILAANEAVKKVDKDAGLY